MKCQIAYKEYLEKTVERMVKDGIIGAVLKNTEDDDFIPSKKYPTDAGYDCRARIEEPIVLQPGKRVKIPLGFGINIPWGCTGDLRPRSGHTEKGIMVGYGTVDPGYTGEVLATIFNLGEEPFVINPKDRIAQLVILPIVITNCYHPVTIQKIDQLLEAERGENGHGSTGVK